MILITGATGTTGSEIIRQLSAASIPARALVRNPTKAQAIQLPHIEIAKGDLSDPPSLDAPMTGVDHLLLLSSPEPGQAALQHNAIEAAKRNGVEHVVKLSAIGADPASPARFLRWHGETERELAASGLQYTNLQPNGFLQNLSAFADSIRAQGMFFAPMADARVSFVDIRDIAAVAVKALTRRGHTGKSYLITGPEAVSYYDVANAFSDALGKPVTYVPVSPEDAKRGMVGTGMPEWLADALNELHDLYREGKTAMVSDVVERVGGKRPRTMAEFVREMAATLR